MLTQLARGKKGALVLEGIMLVGWESPSEPGICPPPDPDAIIVATHWNVNGPSPGSEFDPDGWDIAGYSYNGAYPRVCQAGEPTEWWFNAAKIPPRIVIVTVPENALAGEYSVYIGLDCDPRPGPEDSCWPNSANPFAPFEVVDEVINPPGPDDPICQKT